MRDIMDEKPTEETKKEVELAYPVIPSTSWLEAERHTIETIAENPLIPEDYVGVNAYSALLSFGHKDYMTKKEAVALATKLLELLAPDRLNKE